MSQRTYNHSTGAFMSFSLPLFVLSLLSNLISLSFIVRITSPQMSTSRSSDHLGLRFGVEIELVLRSKSRTHSTFQSLASEIRQHLEKAGISSHIGDLSQKPTGNVSETYQDWIIIQDFTLPSTPAENICKPV